MADLDLTEKLGGQPKYVWILGGVAVVTGFIYYRNRNQAPAPEPVSYDSSLQDGSSGGSGLASSSPMGTPAGIGITSPTPMQSVPKPYSETSAASKPVLKRGATGSLVVLLQKELANNGLNVPATGLFDQQTYVAVKQYQTSRGLNRDGVVGADTWTAITINKKPIATQTEVKTKAKVVAPKVSRVATGRGKNTPKKKTEQA